MHARPISTFRLRQARFLGIEAEAEDGRVRLLIVPVGDVRAERQAASAAASEDVIETALRVEAAMTATIDAVLRERIDYRPEVGGVGRRAGGGSLDFVLADRSGTRRAGIHAMTSVEGIDDVFLRRLMSGNEGLETLTIITGSSAAVCSAAASALDGHLPECELIGGRSPGAIADELVEALWQRLATALDVPNTASFRKRGEA